MRLCPSGSAEKGDNLGERRPCAHPGMGWLGMALLTTAREQPGHDDARALRLGLEMAPLPWPGQAREQQSGSPGAGWAGSGL